MASHADTGFLVDSQVGVRKIHFTRVDKYRSSFIRHRSALSRQGVDSGSAGLFGIDQITKYTGLGDIAFYRANISIISQHYLVFACSKSFSCSCREMADS